MGKKERIVYFTPTVIILFVQLALYRDEGAKTHAAFPAQVTYEFHHIIMRVSFRGEKGIALCRYPR
jgi:hypothetical protein